MSDALIDKHCAACEGGIGMLEADKISALMAQVSDWDISADGKSLQQTFRFKGFYKTMAFINAMAWIANQEGHHPDFSAGYNFCKVSWTTHDAGGLTENDFICAAKTGKLLEQ